MKNNLILIVPLQSSTQHCNCDVIIFQNPRVFFFLTKRSNELSCIAINNIRFMTHKNLPFIVQSYAKVKANKPWINRERKFSLIQVIAFSGHEIDGNCNAMATVPEPPVVSGEHQCCRPSMPSGGGQCWPATPGWTWASCHSPGPTRGFWPVPSAWETPGEKHKFHCPIKCLLSFFLRTNSIFRYTLTSHPKAYIVTLFF